MKKIFCFLTIMLTTISVYGQTLDSYLHRKILLNQLILPYVIDVTFDKTVHLLFPSAVTYVDLGSSDIIADKAGSAENVIRIKAAVPGFEKETNLSVITKDGEFYSFVVRYTDELDRFSINMQKVSMDPFAIYHDDLHGEPVQKINRIMKIIDNKNQQGEVVKSKNYHIHYSLKNIYSHNGLFFFQTEINNMSNIPFEVDFIRVKVIDKKVSKRTAIQERFIEPLRIYKPILNLNGNTSQQSIIALEKIIIPDNKLLVIEIFEKNGSRHQTLIVKNKHLMKAQSIKLIQH